MAPTNYEKGVHTFKYHLAQDMISDFLQSHDAVRRYLVGLSQALADYQEEGDYEEMDALLDEATAAANELAREVKSRATNEFNGPYYQRLLAAAYDWMGIEH